ncbi:hypothetical protein BDD12DRAFT_848123 [Trichophaea hybrida]|nr:hypothetical protein BDD12DRAFT_848123 [Trichophaea hybrida]
MPRLAPVTLSHLLPHLHLYLRILLPLSPHSTSTSHLTFRFPSIYISSRAFSPPRLRPVREFNPFFLIPGALGENIPFDKLLPYMGEKPGMRMLIEKWKSIQW